MSARRVAAVLLGLAVLAVTASAPAGTRKPSQSDVPQGLKAFLLKTDEPATDVFPRTPSFAWKPVPGVIRYEFQLSRTNAFRDSGLVYENESVKAPLVPVPIALPWVTGKPYGYYARVRAVFADRVSEWSDSVGFNLRWKTLPTPLTGYPGLVRWTPVEGATGYEVWYPDADKRFSTPTNVADQREFYTFHQDTVWTANVRWRVRAVRFVYGATKSSLPAVSYGPWSATFTATNPAFATGAMSTVAAVSDVVSDPTTAPDAHRLMPGFVFSGNQSLLSVPYELYRVHVYSDEDCVNEVYTGAVVGSPAYAPRSTGPLELPGDSAEVALARSRYLADGEEGEVFTVDWTESPTTESAKPTGVAESQEGEGDGTGETGEVPAVEGGTGSGSGTTTGSEGTPGSQPGGDGTPGGSGAGSGEPTSDDAKPAPDSSTPTPEDTEKLGAPVDLWDAGWPESGYYWTVVTVRPEPKKAHQTIVAAAAAAGTSTITLSNVGSLSTDDTIRIGKDPTSEEVTIFSVTGNVVTLASKTTFSHATGETVVQTNTELLYRDQDLGGDACAAGHVVRFGKTSEPAVTSSSTPYASGLSTTGTLTAASAPSPTFYGSPLVAWTPALGALAYEVQWSKKSYPFKAEGKLTSYATSATLPLQPGTWYYRVRGLKLPLPAGAQGMAWSDPVELEIAQPRFTVVGGQAQGPSTLKMPKVAKGHKLWSRPAEGFAFTLPSAWDELDKTDPKIAELLGDLAKEGSGLKLLAYDTKSSGEFATNLSLIVGPGLGKAPYKKWVAANVADAKGMKGRSTPVSAKTLKLAGGRVLRVSYRVKDADGELSYLHFMFDGPKKTYMLTFTTVPKLAKSYFPVFSKTAVSFRHS
jgi:hypothetical protein